MSRMPHGIREHLSIFAILPIITVFVLVTLGCQTGEPESPTEEVTVQLKWHHQAQFAGFYAAEQNGYYAAEGLIVSFIEGGPEVDLHNSVLDGRAQFAVAAADTLIVSRAEGKPVGAIAAVFRRNPLVFFAMADSNITGPQDFIGKTIRVPPRQQPIFTKMMNRVGVSPDQYTVVCCELEAFFSGDIDGSSGYLTNEVLAAQDAGYKLNIIYPEDYGVHIYADTIFTTDNFITNRPDLVRRFLHATLKGWRWAIENPEEAAILALNYDPTLSADLQVAQMLAGIPLIHTGEDQIGWMQSDVWQGMIGWLMEQGALTESVELDEVYTMEFLQQIYGEGGF